ncbi:hypothetical protein I2F27_04075 [Acinetobacter sp. B5B]|uniref:hypothetical protein n=1 Tax=Acinetobacter baretiae TaxID=2605383 RepID=UPI0018C33DC3|nr:hypothetical protein [Acinetobacter baretiae]MBF7682510.1 hypothetical protein [Acinetobacter baretiae]MBF7685223.1 hypothetical protein [Acinetobacter baretiae]
MFIQVIKKHLDSSTLCPLCQAAMYWVDAEQQEQEFNFHQCSHCQHRIFQTDHFTCHCERCTKQRKNILKETRFQEYKKKKFKDRDTPRLDKISFLHKLFLLALLDDNVREDSQHNEFIDWNQLKYSPISPNVSFQNTLMKQLEKEDILCLTEQLEDCATYHINVRLDGYTEPSLFSVVHQLRAWFYENLSQGVPFEHSDEVKDVLYLMLYQEIVQFSMFICRPWGIQITGHSALKQLCYQLLDQLAVEQIFHLVYTALSYLHEKNALETRNDGFINTHRLKKTIIQYRERAIAQRWETPNFPRPEQLPFHKMGEILYFKFLNYDQKILSQPIRFLWQSISPRLGFYSDKRCMQCGSNELDIEYDAQSYVSMICRQCKHRDHYFTQ